MKSLKKILSGTAATLLLFSMAGGSASAQTVTTGRNCSPTAFAAASTNTHSKLVHTHTYVAQSGTKFTRNSPTATTSFGSAGSFNNATITLSNNSTESFKSWSTYCLNQ